MNAFAGHPVLLLSIAAFAACGDRTLPDDDISTPVIPDVSDTADSEEASAGEVVCGEGLTACEGECIDLTSGDEHCGVCGHACKEPWLFGGCMQGACPSAIWCGGVEQNLETCGDVCAHHGQTCHEGPRVGSRGCGGESYVLHFDHDALGRCEIGVGGGHLVQDVTCSTPIDWSIEGGFDREPAQAVSCCCTQDPPA